MAPLGFAGSVLWRAAFVVACKLVTFMAVGAKLVILAMDVDLRLLLISQGLGPLRRWTILIEVRAGCPISTLELYCMH